jgi:hypothetical protein
MRRANGAVGARVKVYQVQTWDKDGARTNHYESILSGAAEVKQLRDFLKKTHALVLITPLPAKRKR